MFLRLFSSLTYIPVHAHEKNVVAEFLMFINLLSAAEIKVYVCQPRLPRRYGDT
jgi:hypothetical protein